MTAEPTPLTTLTMNAISKGQKINDARTPGLTLIGRDRGAAWSYYYRTKSGEARRPTLGRYPQVGLEAARRIVKELSERIAKGEDPSGKWQDARGGLTVGQLCDDYLAKWTAVRKSGASAKEERRIIESYVRPVLGRRPLTSVKLDDIEKLLGDIASGKFRSQVAPKGSKRRDGNAGSPFMANRVRAALSKMFVLAVDRWKLLPLADNPMRGVMRYTEPKRRVVATPDDLRAIAGALKQLTPLHPREVAAVMVLIYTGARVNEIAGAKLAHLDLAAGTLVLTEHKTVKTIGPKTIYLPPNAVDILSSIPPDGSGYVFGGGELTVLWKKVRKLSGVAFLQLRDIRRTFASVALSNGVSLDIIGGLFGHTNTQTTRGYSWLTPNAAVEAAGATALRLQKMLEG